MIVDSSVVVALLQREEHVAWIIETLAAAGGQPLRMSWVNIAEVAMALERRKTSITTALQPALDRVGIQPADIDFDIVRLAAIARQRFPLNFGDCFAYAHAKLTGEPLLTLDSDVLKTDLPAVLHPDA